MTLDARRLDDLFTSVLPAHGFAVREGQVAMASFVATALAKNRHLVAEAGVGTGKTYAYLVPLMLHMQHDPRPVIIATHAIALQNQLMQDIPAIARLVNLPAPALLAKGREHYTCRLAVDRLAEQPELGEAVQKLASWGRRTGSGDRATGPQVPDALWSQVAWGEQAPCGARCRAPERCASGRMRRQWQELESGFIVTNHHQFFADLALRGRGAHLFPQAGAIVLDEAHAAIDAARDMLGARAQPSAVFTAFKDAVRLARVTGFDGVLAAARAWPAVLTGAVEWGGSEEAERFVVKPDQAVVDAARLLAEAGGRLVSTLAGQGDRPDRVAALDGLMAVVQPLRGLLDPGGQVAWVEGDRRSRRVHVLASAPRELGPILAERLFQRQVPVILTSATLAPEGDFGWFQRAIGLSAGIGPGKPLRCLAESPFDYAEQARLYIAADLPDPATDADAFYAAALTRLSELVNAVGGRALALFTARSRAKAAEAALALSVPVRLQGREAWAALAELESLDTGLVLGTAYWTGVDVRGLSLVIIVKLPFPPPDPLLAAQEAAARARGEDPFETLLLPMMLLRLRQGVGRLIRREGDRGVVAILDPRAATRAYAARIAEALPEWVQVASVAEAGAFVHHS